MCRCRVLQGGHRRARRVERTGRQETPLYLSLSLSLAFVDLNPQ